MNNSSLLNETCGTAFWAHWHRYTAKSQLSEPVLPVQDYQFLLLFWFQTFLKYFVNVDTRAAECRTVKYIKNVAKKISGSNNSLKPSIVLYHSLQDTSLGTVNICTHKMVPLRVSPDSLSSPLVMQLSGCPVWLSGGCFHQTLCAQHYCCEIRMCHYVLQRSKQSFLILTVQPPQLQRSKTV